MEQLRVAIFIWHKDFYERTLKRYAHATNTILTNCPVIKSQWVIVTWLNVTKPGKWLIICVINYVVIKCQLLIASWWNDVWWKVIKLWFLRFFQNKVMRKSL